MFYRKYPPCQALQPYVESYFIWDSEGPLPTDLIVESPPTGYCSLVFNYGDAYHLQNKKYNDLPVPMQFVAGQSIYRYKLFLSGTVRIAGIVMKPAALSTIFRLRMFEFTEERIDMAAVIPPDIVHQVIAGLFQGGDEPAKISLLEAFLLQQVRQHNPQPDYIDTAANCIVERNGLLQVNDLLKDSCMSRRTFERKFLHKVGLSPKYYARIRRISHLCYLITGKKQVDWCDTFYECNFYDQAHFIKDFEAFLGCSPQQYLKENAELIHYVT